MRFILVACVGAAPLLVAAAEPVRIQPSGPWILEYAENSCRLMRTFGVDDTKMVMVLESPAPDEMSMLIIGKPLQTNADAVVARFLPVGGKGFAGLTAKSATSRDPAVLWSSVPWLPEDVIERLEKEVSKRRPDVRPQPVDLAEKSALLSQRRELAAKAVALEIKVRRNRLVTLETGSMGEPVKQFDQCIRDSLKDWGVDPELEDKIVQPVWATNHSKWFDSQDYPSEMVRRGEESVVNVRLLVDASGKATKCTSFSHFKDPEFNQITCNNIMKSAQFTPAELADGTKVPSYYTQRVKFQLGR